METRTRRCTGPIARCDAPHGGPGLVLVLFTASALMPKERAARAKRCSVCERSFGEATLLLQVRCAFTSPTVQH